MSEKKQVLIELKSLEPSPYNYYMTVDSDEETDSNHIEDMARSIRALGLFTPLTVIGPMENGKYQILSGERRYRALTMISGEEGYDGSCDNVPCYLVGGSDTNKLFQKLVVDVANLETRDMSNKDEHVLNMIGTLKSMKEEGLVEDANLVVLMDKYLKCSDRYKRMYISIESKATDETKDMLLSHKISVKEAAAISNLPEKAQRAAIESIENGEVDKKDVMSAVSSFKNKAKEFKKEKDLANMTESGEIKRAFDSYEESVESDGFEDEESEFDDKEAFFAKLDEGFEDEAFREEINNLKYKDNTDLIQSSISNVKQLARETSNSSGEKDKIVEVIEKWANKMLKRNKFTEEEVELCDLLQEVIDHVGNSDRIS